MMLPSAMMSPSAMMCACGHMRANIASLRHEVTQHHFGTSRYIISR